MSRLESIALVGGAQRNRDMVNESLADEVWGTSMAYQYGLKRLDAIFEMHPIWISGEDARYEYAGARQHWDWLKQNTKTAVYMLQDCPEVPRCVVYPIGEVCRFIFGKRPPEFSSTLDYMMALAITRQVKRIEIYGFEMGSNTEYVYQREGFAYFRGFAESAGIEVIIPENSRLRRRKLYGYEGGQMIARHDLERYMQLFYQEHNKAVANLQYYNGAMDATEGADKKAEFEKAYHQARDQALITSGAVQLLKYLLQEVDLEEPEIKLENPLREAIQS